MAKTALVTGAAGFIGRHFVRHLEEQGWQVVGRDIEWGAPVEELVSDHRHRYDLVIHAAARSAHRLGIDTDHGAGPYNAMLDAAMIEWAIRTEQPRFVYLSSCAVYSDRDYQHEDPAWTGYGGGTPCVPIVEELVGTGAHGYLSHVDIYGAVKRTGERLCEQATAAGVGVTVVRPFSGYGEDQGADWPFGAFRERALRAVQSGGPVEIWGSGQQVRDWIHVDDVVRGTMALVDAEVREPVNLCTGRGTSMIDLLSMMLARAAAYDLVIHGSVFIVPNLDRPEGSPYRVGDPTLLHRYYVPSVSLEDGVARALAAPLGRGA